MNSLFLPFFYWLFHRAYSKVSVSTAKKSPMELEFTMEHSLTIKRSDVRTGP